jgi:hypothetical protein
LQVHSLLTESEQNVVAGYVVYRNMRRLDTSTSTIERFLHFTYGLFPSKSWYSRFRKKQHLSYRLTSVAKWSENSRRKWKEGIRHIESIREDIKLLNLPDYKVAAIDKVKFRLMSKNVRQVGIRGGYGIICFFFFFFYTYFIAYSLVGSRGDFAVMMFRML